MLADKCVVIVTFMIPVSIVSVRHQFRRILNFIMKKLWSLVLKTYIMTFQLLQDSPDHVQAYQASLMSRKTYFIELVYVY